MRKQIWLNIYIYIFIHIYIYIYIMINKYILDIYIQFMEFRLWPLGFMVLLVKQQSSGSYENEINRKSKNTVKKPFGFCRNLFLRL